MVDVPPLRKGMEPYSVGPIPGFGENVVTNLLPTHPQYNHTIQGPAEASAPGPGEADRFFTGINVFAKLL